MEIQLPNGAKTSAKGPARILGLNWLSLFTGLDWTGLDWTGLDWSGVDWSICNQSLWHIGDVFPVTPMHAKLITSDRQQALVM